MALSTTDVVSRAKQAQNEKDEWLSIYQESYASARPGQNAYFANGDGNPHSGRTIGGQRRRFQTLTVVLEEATEALINRVVTDFFPSKSRFANFGPPPSLSMEEAEGLTPLLDEAERIAFSYLHDSNFDQAIGPVVGDCIVGGTMFLGQRFDPVKSMFIYTPIPLPHMAIEQDSEGNPVAFFRNILMTFDEMKAHYTDTTLTKDDVGDLGSAKKPKKLKIVEGCVWNEDENEWEFHVILKGVAKGAPTAGPIEIEPMRTYTKERCPFVMARWSRSPDETYGRSPVMAALPEFRTLNGAVRALMQTAITSARGIYLKGAKNSFSFQDRALIPGGVYTVQDVSQFTRIQTPESTPDLIHQIETSKQNIRNVMLYNRLPDPREKGNHPSAEEIIQRRKEARTDYGIAGANFDAFGEQILRFIISHLVEKDEVIGELAEDLKQAEITLNSPLATNQKANDFVQLYEFLQSTKSLPMTDPMMYGTIINEKESLREMARLAGIPARLVRSEEEAQEEFARMQEGIAQAQLAAQASQGGGEQAGGAPLAG